MLFAKYLHFIVWERECVCVVLVVAFCSHLCTRARSWREFAKSRFTHFPSILSVHVDSYVVSMLQIVKLTNAPGCTKNLFAKFGPIFVKSYLICLICQLYEQCFGHLMQSTLDIDNCVYLTTFNCRSQFSPCFCDILSVIFQQVAILCSFCQF